jgi:hypothetical protein
MANNPKGEKVLETTTDLNGSASEITSTPR